jgi:hypothetical protein
MKPQPRHKHILKRRVGRSLRETRLFMLQARPGRFVGADAPLPFPFFSEAGRKVIKERFHLEAIQWPRHTTGHSEDVLQAQHAHTKGV